MMKTVLQRGARVIPQAKRTFSTASFNDRDAVIVSAVRTPIGAYMSSLSSLTAPQLGAIAVRGAIERSQINVKDIDEVLLGNVVSAGLGQCPATQAASHGGVPIEVPSTTINKVCSSGMKAVMFGAQSIMLGQQNVVIGGGFESMSNIPHYLMKARQGYGYGHGELVDGCIKDGLWDAFDNQHMGNAGEACASEYKFSRADQDAYCIETFRRAQEATTNGSFKREIIPVTITDKKGNKTVVDIDEEPGKLKADKVPSLKPAFKKDGTVTAANASNINDGASALVLVSGAYARKHNLKPIARIRGFADAQKKPIEFTTAPSVAIPRAMKAAGVSASDVSYYEINEAFSVVSLANIKILNLDPTRVNAFGGSVALGHPLGSSGSRIIVTLLNVLASKQGTIGVAGICNGGGGASAIVVELL